MVNWLSERYWNLLSILPYLILENRFKQVGIWNKFSKNWGSEKKLSWIVLPTQMYDVFGYENKVVMGATLVANLSALKYQAADER